MSEPLPCRLQRTFAKPGGWRVCNGVKFFLKKHSYKYFKDATSESISTLSLGRQTKFQKTVVLCRHPLHLALGQQTKTVMYICNLLGKSKHTIVTFQKPRNDCLGLIYLKYILYSLQKHDQKWPFTSRNFWASQDKLC